MADVKQLADALARLANAADTYMAAVVAYNSNPWDRVNIRGYATAKDELANAISQSRKAKASRTNDNA